LGELAQIGSMRAFGHALGIPQSIVASCGRKSFAAFSIIGDPISPEG